MMTFHLKSRREEKLGNYNYLSIESMAQEFKLLCILFRLARLARIKHRRLDSPTQRSAEQLRRELYGSGRGWERTRRIGLLNKFSTDKKFALQNWKWSEVEVMNVGVERGTESSQHAAGFSEQYRIETSVVFNCETQLISIRTGFELGATFGTWEGKEV